MPVRSPVPFKAMIFGIFMGNEWRIFVHVEKLQCAAFICLHRFETRNAAKVVQNTSTLGLGRWPG